MSNLLNGFNNGVDKSDGIGGSKPINQLANNVCANCKFCELKENENWKLSNVYQCLLTDENINDVDRDYCDDFDYE